MDLTAPAPADSDALFRWINDRDTMILTAPFRPVARQDYDRWLARVANAPNVSMFVIRISGRPIGTCQLFDISMLHRSAGLQIRIGEKSARGLGYGTAAIQDLLDYAMRLGLHRVWLQVFATNSVAIRCYEKCGFQVEGALSNAAEIEGQLIDVIRMGAVLQ